jgi:hypothetical protein
MCTLSASMTIRVVVSGTGNMGREVLAAVSG